MIPKHLDDCDRCSHQRMHHDDETGECKIGKMMNQQCPCPGFQKK